MDKPLVTPDARPAAPMSPAPPPGTELAHPPAAPGPPDGGYAHENRTTVPRAPARRAGPGDMSERAGSAAGRLGL